MEKQKSTKPLYQFPQLDEIAAADEFMIKQQILRYRLLGMTETAIYFASGQLVPMAAIRTYVKEIDGWIESGVSQVQEHLNEKELDRLLTIRRLDYVIEERVVLYQNEDNNSVRLRVLNAMRDDLDRRADLLGLKQGVKKDAPSGVGAETGDLPNLSMEDLFEMLQENVKAKNKD